MATWLPCRPLLSPPMAPICAAWTAAPGGDHLAQAGRQLSAGGEANMPAPWLKSALRNDVNVTLKSQMLKGTGFL